MRHFDLNAILAEAHQEFPVAQRRPVIGITGNYGELTCKLGEGYYKQIVAAGGVPMIIPPVADKTDRKSTRLNSSHIATSRMPSSA